MQRVVRVIALVAFVATAASATAQTLRVTATTTNLRTQPSADAAIVATLAQGAELDVMGDVMGKDGTWYRVRVRLSGAEGFVHSLVVETIAGAAAGEPAPMAPAAPSPPPAPRSPAPAVSPAPQSTVSAAERQYFVRLHGGLVSVFDTTGFGFGGGGAGRFPGGRAAEIQGDALYARLSESAFGLTANISFLQISGNYLHNFVQSTPSFTPFAGGGLVFSRTSVSISDSLLDDFFLENVFQGSKLGVQLLGGIQLPMSDKTAFRGELRIGLYSGGSSVSVLGGISF